MLFPKLADIRNAATSALKDRGCWLYRRNGIEVAISTEADDDNGVHYAVSVQRGTKNFIRKCRNEVLTSILDQIEEMCALDIERAVMTDYFEVIDQSKEKEKVPPSPPAGEPADDPAPEDAAGIEPVAPEVQVAISTIVAELMIKTVTLDQYKAQLHPAYSRAVYDLRIAFRNVIDGIRPKNDADQGAAETNSREAWFGQTASRVLNWLGAEGFSVFDATQASRHCGLRIAKNTIGAQVGYGRRDPAWGRARATLTEAQKEELTQFKGCAANESAPPPEVTA